MYETVTFLHVFLHTARLIIEAFYCRLSEILRSNVRAVQAEHLHLGGDETT